MLMISCKADIIDLEFQNCDIIVLKFPLHDIIYDFALDVDYDIICIT
jgi:hypothetical protein